MNVRNAVLLMALWLVLAGILVGMACSAAESGGNSGDVVRATWIQAEIDGDSVSLPVQDIDAAELIHFKVAGETGNMVFMAYRVDGQLHLRAAICPPCRSVGFSLDGNNLVCDSCGTRFEATSGAGVSGACKGYPKAEATGSVSEGKFVVTMADLANAYENTRTPGWP